MTVNGAAIVQQPLNCLGIHKENTQQLLTDRSSDTWTPFYDEYSGTLSSALARYEPIHLSEMAGAALLKRVEVKYVLPSRLLPFLLEPLQDSYYMLEVEGHRLNRYRTLYFDTPDFAMYQHHHNRVAERFKIRTRTYVESNASFLEVKHKTNKKRVIKSRIETSALVTDLDDNAVRFVSSACPYGAEGMQPRLRNSYRRITLVAKDMRERVTLDINLHFDWQGRSVGLPVVVVAEVKQERHAQMSALIQLMRQHHIRSTGFSKYCIGASMLYPTLKHNRFKSKHRLLDKLMQGERYGLH